MIGSPLGIGIFVAVVNENQAISGLNNIGKAADSLAKKSQGIDFSKLRFGMEQAGSLFDPITNNLKRGFSEAMKFEKTMQTVQGVLSPKEWKESENAIRDMTRSLSFKYGEDPAKAGEAVREIVKAGIKAKDADFAPITEAIVAIAKLEGSNPERVATILARMSHMMTNSFGAIPEIGGKMVAMSNETTASLTSMFESMKYGSPVMSRFGLDMDKQVALMGLFADSGRPGSLGGTTIGRMLENIAGQSFKSVDNIKLMQLITGDGTDLSKNIFDAKGHIRDLFGFIKALGDQWEKMPGDMKQGIITKIFNVRGSPGFDSINRVLREAPERLQHLLKVASGAGGQYSITQASARVDNFAGSIDKLKTSIMNLTGQVLEGLMKGGSGKNFILELAEDITKVGGAFVSMYRDGLSPLAATEKWGAPAVRWAQTIKGLAEGIAEGFGMIVAPIKWLMNLGNDSGVARFIGKMIVLVPAVTALFGAIGMIGLGVSALMGLGGALGLGAAGAATGGILAGGWAGAAIGIGTLLVKFSLLAGVVIGVIGAFRLLTDYLKAGRLQREADRLNRKSDVTQAGLDTAQALIGSRANAGFGTKGYDITSLEQNERPMMEMLRQKYKGMGGTGTLGDLSMAGIKSLQDLGVLPSSITQGKNGLDQAEKSWGTVVQNQSAMVREMVTGALAGSGGLLDGSLVPGYMQNQSSSALMMELKSNVIKAVEASSFGGKELPQFMRLIISWLVEIHAEAVIGNAKKDKPPQVKVEAKTALNPGNALRVLAVVHAETSARNGNKDPFTRFDAQAGRYKFG